MKEIKNKLQNIDTILMQAFTERDVYTKDMLIIKAGKIVIELLEKIENENKRNG